MFYLERHLETDVTADLRGEDPSPSIERLFMSTVSAWHIIDVEVGGEKEL